MHIYIYIYIYMLLAGVGGELRALGGGEARGGRGAPELHQAAYDSLSLSIYIYIHNIE